MLSLAIDPYSSRRFYRQLLEMSYEKRNLFSCTTLPPHYPQFDGPLCLKISHKSAHLPLRSRPNYILEKFHRSAYLSLTCRRTYTSPVGALASQSWRIHGSMKRLLAIQCYMVESVSRHLTGWRTYISKVDAPTS